MGYLLTLRIFHVLTYLYDCDQVGCETVGDMQQQYSNSVYRECRHRRRNLTQTNGYAARGQQEKLLDPRSSDRNVKRWPLLLSGADRCRSTRQTDRQTDEQHAAQRYRSSRRL